MEEKVSIQKGIFKREKKCVDCPRKIEECIFDNKN